jgi:hypothetical protein
VYDSTDPSAHQCAGCIQQHDPLEADSNTACPQLCLAVSSLPSTTHLATSTAQASRSAVLRAKVLVISATAFSS